MLSVVFIVYWCSLEFRQSSYRFCLSPPASQSYFEHVPCRSLFFISALGLDRGNFGKEYAKETFSPAKTNAMPKEEKRGCEANPPVEDGHDGPSLIISNVVEQVTAKDKPRRNACH